MPSWLASARKYPSLQFSRSMLKNNFIYSFGIFSELRFNWILNWFTGMQIKLGSNIFYWLLCWSISHISVFSCFSISFFIPLKNVTVPTRLLMVRFVMNSLPPKIISLSRGFSSRHLIVHFFVNTVRWPQSGIHSSWIKCLNPSWSFPEQISWELLSWCWRRMSLVQFGQILGSIRSWLDCLGD